VHQDISPGLPRSPATCEATPGKAQKYSSLFYPPPPACHAVALAKVEGGGQKRDTRSPLKFLDTFRPPQYECLHGDCFPYLGCFGRMSYNRWLGTAYTVQPTFIPESRHLIHFHRQPYCLGGLRVWTKHIEIVAADLPSVCYSRLPWFCQRPARLVLTVSFGMPVMLETRMFGLHWLAASHL